MPDGHGQRGRRVQPARNVQIAAADGAGTHLDKHLVRCQRADGLMQKVYFKRLIYFADTVHNFIHGKKPPLKIALQKMQTAQGNLIGGAVYVDPAGVQPARGKGFHRDMPGVAVLLQ